MSDDGSFWGGFAGGALAMLFLVFVCSAIWNVAKTMTLRFFGLSTRTSTMEQAVKWLRTW